MQNTPFSINKTLNIHGRVVTFDEPRIMGVLNITPDSFFDGGRYTSEMDILKQAEKLIREGADFIDVGGYSSRPGAVETPEAEELNRVIPAIGLIRKEFPETAISIDTFRSAIAAAAVSEGAGMINDISGGSLDPSMFETASRAKVPYVLMHMRGNPATMAKQTDYTNLVKEVIDHFHHKIDELHKLLVKDIIIDPGFGFAKTREQNFELLNHLDGLDVLGKPVLTGLSRKSMVWKTLSISPEEALNGTTVLNTMALLKGVSILRVHDVREAKECITLFSALRKEAGRHS